jgi:hypothetical protein
MSLSHLLRHNGLRAESGLTPIATICTAGGHQAPALSIFCFCPQIRCSLQRRVGQGVRARPRPPCGLERAGAK